MNLLLLQEMNQAEDRTFKTFRRALKTAVPGIGIVLEKPDIQYQIAEKQARRRVSKYGPERDDCKHVTKQRLRSQESDSLGRNTNN